MVLLKIEFEVPEWAIGRHIHIFAGVELLANKEVRIVHENGKHIAKYLPLKIKQADGRCNGCGECCSDGGLNHIIIERIKKVINIETDKCVFFSETGCILGAFKPFSCAKTVCSDYDNCSERLE